MDSAIDGGIWGVTAQQTTGAKHAQQGQETAMCTKKGGVILDLL